MAFHLQIKSDRYEIWVIAEHRTGTAREIRADRVCELEAEIRKAADFQTSSYPDHYRIVTNKGDPVSRWKTWPGRVKKLRARY